MKYLTIALLFITANCLVSAQLVENVNENLPLPRINGFAVIITAFAVGLLGAVISAGVGFAKLACLFIKDLPFCH